MAEDFIKRASEFFKSYIDIVPEGLNTDGTIRDFLFPLCTKKLLTNGVFVSKTEMKKEALQDYKVILPDYFFESEVETE